MLKQYLTYISFFFVVTWVTPVFSCESTNNCIQKGQWDIGLAIGIGARSNPLVDGKNFPNVILFDVAWYGDEFYFDNGEIGYKWLQKDAFGVETYLTLDREMTFFELWHPGNVTVPAALPSSPAIEPPTSETDDGDLSPAEEPLSVNDISDRNWAINFGTRVHYYHANYEISFSLETDVSGVHQGQKATLSYQYFWSGDTWRFMLRPSLVWKSANLANYYYGVDKHDTENTDYHYQVSAGLQPGIALLYTQKINADWHWITNLSYRKLHSSMVHSPIVEENNVTNVFIGLGRRF
ncbi:MipA/OmpV family protein [Aliiglaciecola lipolytica]|uniref:Outer membrane protein n=1 Tax=Aliiglaciecola lipolytica E3 TaxID=1127673 RepID=K6X464_9ALTE|nr:MipA/OmpV family protein [Aliiglaciecola lipolytica]GAC15409.1 outer membrane protein [Aliiglaciecola lipolytica E3]